MANTARCFAVAMLLLCANAAWAQSPPAAEPPPQPDAGTTAQANCIEENDHYARRGNTPTFVITMENKCERRLRCRVFAFITSARGIAQGRGSIVLAPKSQGAAAKGSFVMKARMIGGSSMSDRECRVF